MDTGAEVWERDRVSTERRAHPRGPAAKWPGEVNMIRAAQLAFGPTVLDCALMDTSRGGARVHLFAPAELPEVATLRAGGESWTVQRRWQKGLEAGFRVLGGGPTPG